MCPEKDIKAGERAESNILGEAAEDSRFVQFGKKEVEGRFHWCLCLPEEGQWRERGADAKIAWT